MEVLQGFAFELTVEEVARRMHLPPDDSQMLATVEELVDRSLEVARPQALYRVGYVTAKGEGCVEIEGMRFTSRVLRKNLDSVQRVFPYVATCGVELEEMPLPEGDFMAPYLMDTIKLLVMGQALGHLFEYLNERYALPKTAKMSPGSLEDWPITEQTSLFSLFGDVEQLIGVRLSDTYLMYPVKSVSGLLYPTEVSFASCQLCPREVCTNRSAPYDPRLAAEYGVAKVGDSG